ncbi:MAG: Hsp70 family protein [Anaerolineaceae bacterium]|nr:Hsp70 family protein [Anaerolineaceae bacterium]
MSTIIGIDLGTTNSGVSVVQNGLPIMIPNGNERIIPSVVSCSPDNKWLVGTPARNQYILDPENTVRSIKRKMGSDSNLTLAGKKYSPQEISAFILRELKRIAEQNLGHEISEAVITVPAYFSDAARQATRDAGRIAGFNVRRIINEPTAAALAYGLNQAEDQTVLVYDLGGGTFDVSLVELMSGIVEVCASHGNTQLGGDDFDQLLAEKLASWFEETHDVNVRNDRRAWARLLRAAEIAKIQLSSHPYAWVKEEYLTEKRGVPLHLEYEVSRKDFNTMIQPLLQKTLESIDQVILDSGVPADEINQVFMVGGSSYIPAVWELVADQLDKEPHMSVNPEEVVALGAGVQAAIIAGDPIDAILVDVTPYSLGISVVEMFLDQLIDDRFRILIRRNTTIPTTKEEEFYTIYPGQKTIRIKVYQGESPVASDNLLLGEFVISDLEPETPGDAAEITVQFDFDVNGILKVTAQARKTGKQENLTVEASRTRLSEKEILAARQWTAEELTPSADPSPEMKALINRAHKLLEGQSLLPDDRQELEALMAEIEASSSPKDNKDLDARMQTLLDLLFDIEE